MRKWRPTKLIVLGKIIKEWFKDRIVVPKDAELRQQILDEAHLSRYSIHPRSTEMYQDLKQHYW
jgi:hypothetical protein